MNKLLQCILDKCFYARRHIAATLAFLTLRIYGKEIMYSEVKDGKFKQAPPSLLNLDDAKDISTLLDLSKESLKSAEKRRNIITDKCKTLLTLGSLLLGVIGLLLPKYLAFDSLWMRGMSILAIAILFNAIVLLLMFFDVGTDMEISLTQTDVTLDKTNLEKSLLNQHRACTADSENRTNYLVDLYQATRFCLLSALTIVAGLVLANLIIYNPEAQKERSIRELRSNFALTDLQGGVKSDIGENGPDLNDLTTHLLSDARLQEAINIAIEKHTKKASLIPQPKEDKVPITTEWDH